MKTSDFSYNLPNELIARYPADHRSSSRMLILDKATGGVEHGQFADLVGFLREGDLLVFNNTKVIPARLLGQKKSGGKVEILVERILDDCNCLALVRANKSPKKGAVLLVEGETFEVTGRKGGLFCLKFDGGVGLLDFMERDGHMPLPPYIDREPEALDEERYQTVYAEVPGAVAAPTAGLHFDDSVFSDLLVSKIEMAYVTLHVGAGTFQPVKVDDVRDHEMHSEIYSIEKSVSKKIAETKKRGGRVIAVGTTSVRALESAFKKGKVRAGEKETDIFITPGYEFKVIDGLITNFHLPESTLLMLVSAFAGRDNVLAAYEQAVQEQYRFFSYGDAMLIL